MAKILETADAYDAVDVYKLPKDGEYDDINALRICVQDAESAEAWLDQHYFQVRWTEADVMYQSPPILKCWEGTQVPRANISKFTVATHINALTAMIGQGLFYEKPPFMLQPRPSTDQNTVRAITTVQDVQLEEMKFKRHVKRGLFSALLFGTAIWKWGWKTYDKVEKRYERKEAAPEVTVGSKTIKIPTERSKEFKCVETTKTVAAPYFENVDIRYVLVDPGNRTGDIRDSKFVIERLAMTYRQLVKLRDEQILLGEDTYNLPSEAVIRSWYEQPTEAGQSDGDNSIASAGSSPYIHHAAPRFQKTTEDPLDEPLEILERWSPERVTAVINKCFVMRNSCNTLEAIPYYNVNWWPIPDAFWGIGLGSLLAYEQRIQQGLINASIDMASLIVNPQYARSRGANVTSQSIRQRLGGIIDVDGDPEKAFRLLEVPEIPGEIYGQIQQSEARSEATSGANELLTMGNMPAKGRTSIGRTATGASALSSASQSRIGSFVEEFVDQVMEPWLWRMHDLNCEFLPPDTLKQILSDELGKAFEIDESDYFNASIKKFEVMAGSHLAVKQQMSQALVLMTQLFESPQTMEQLSQINGKYVDVEELMHMIADMSGFTNYYSIVKPLTPEMEQRMQQNNPAAQQAVAKTQQMAQQHQNDSELIDQKSINNAVVVGMKPMIEHKIQMEEGERPQPSA